MVGACRWVSCRCGTALGFSLQGLAAADNTISGKYTTFQKITNFMKTDKKKKPEILAPAGSINVFEKALEAGADAVYIGAPALNARALARDFSLPEIMAMIEFAHSRGARLYLAANSLLKEAEIPQALETLAQLEEMQPDALIIQDLGIYHLCRKYFPQLQLHASTLMGAHNSLAVKQFEKMGFDRVVLARELTIREIKSIAGKTMAELEVFVHGALCFSYSGLCLFSSYHGGKSGLRGRCVQPCRRRYRWEAKTWKPGYLFSMNDLNAIDLVHQLADIGIASFKIEGRLRSSHYVSSVVRAYRLVVDAAPGDEKTLAEAGEILQQAMGRKTSSGYFSSSQPKDLITPYHSGNIGLFLGRAGRNTSKGRVQLSLKQPVQTGDRLRLHQEKTGERTAFTLRNLVKDGRMVAQAARGENVILEVPARVRQGDSLFKVDSREARETDKEESMLQPAEFDGAVKKIQAKIKQKIASVQNSLVARTGRKKKRTAFSAGKGGKQAQAGLPLYLRIDDLQLLKLRLPFMPELFLVALNRKTFADLKRLQKQIKKVQHKIAWSLPPVIMEDDLDFYRQAVQQLLANNFRTWQLGHIGQRFLFPEKSRISLLGDFTLNVLNSQALFVLSAMRIKRVQAAVEIDKKNLADLSGSRSAAASGVSLGLTLYGTPPLFTARLMADHFHYEQPFTSPKGERFVLRKGFQSTVALAENPFSLLARLPELARLGVQYGIIDFSHRKIESREINEIGRELFGKGARRKLSTFNYFGELL